MLIINKSLVHLADNKLFAEASTIGLGPGEWPDFITVVITDGDNGVLFHKSYPEMGGGDIQSYIYSSNSGARLIIHND